MSSNFVSLLLLNENNDNNQTITNLNDDDTGGGGGDDDDKNDLMASLTVNNDVSLSSSLIQLTNKQTQQPSHHKLYSQCSSDSTSSVTSGLSVLNANGFELINNDNHTPISASQSTLTGLPALNPFEETNKFRLDKSILSPNLFHVASTSTPERDTSNLWNIDQRAVLYPADIPTDESSLIAQYMHDNRLNKQVSAALEVFWTKTEKIIESPLATSDPSSSSSVKQFNTRIGLSNSPKNSTNNRNSSRSTSSSTTTKQRTNNLTNSKKKSSNNNNNQIKTKNQSNSNRFYSTTAISGSISSLNSLSSLVNNTNASRMSSTTSVNNDQLSTKIKSNKKDQICQTILSLPLHVDLNQIPQLKEYLNTKKKRSPNHKHVTKKLNTSIRKKLFDQNSDDISSSSTTSKSVHTKNKNFINTDDDSIISPNHPPQSKILNPHSHLLPKPELRSSSEAINSIQKSKLNLNKLKTLASSSCSSTDWDISFEFDDHRASSPKYNRILYDFDDFNNKTVVEPTDGTNYKQNKTSPDISPFYPIPLKISAESDQQQKSQHINSPNLSPIRVDEIEKPKKSTSLSSSPKKKHQKSFKQSDNYFSNLSASSIDSYKSNHNQSISAINEKMTNSRKENHDISFIEHVSQDEHRYDNKREEIYTNNNFYYDNLKSQQQEDNTNYLNQSLIITSDLSRTNSLNLSSNLKAYKTTKKHNKLESNSNNNKTNLNSNETNTTNTFLINQSSSQDTGYQTNLGASVFPNGSSTNSSANPSLMLMDTTNFNKTNELKKPSSLNLCIGETGQLVTITSTPMSLGDDEQYVSDEFINSFNNSNQNNQLFVQTATNSLDIMHDSKNYNKNLLEINKDDLSSKGMIDVGVKKSASMSLNSFENIQPVESSTPEKLKQRHSSLLIKSKSFVSSNLTDASTKPKANKLNKNNFIDINKNNNNSNIISNSTNKLINSNSSHEKDSSIIQKIKYFKAYGRSRDHLAQNFDQSIENDKNSNSNNNLNETSFQHHHNNNQSFKRILKVNNSCDNLLQAKQELNVSFVDNSILSKKIISPSEYAQTLIEKAKRDLSATNVYFEKTKTDELRTNFKNIFRKNQINKLKNISMII